MQTDNKHCVDVPKKKPKAQGRRDESKDGWMYYTRLTGRSRVAASAATAAAIAGMYQIS